MATGERSSILYEMGSRYRRQSVAVTVTGASVVGTVYTSGVSGANIVISRNNTTSAEAANFIAELIQ